MPKKKEASNHSLVEDKIKHLPIKVDRISHGMTITQMKEAYQGAEFISEPVWTYGIDGESDGILVKLNEEELFFVWTMFNNDTIRGITVLSKSIILEGGIRVGLTVEELFKSYPKGTMKVNMIDEETEYFYIPILDLMAEFLPSDSKRVASYDWSKGEPEFVEVLKPDATVDRISLIYP